MINFFSGQTSLFGFGVKKQAGKNSSEKERARIEEIIKIMVQRDIGSVDEFGNASVLKETNFNAIFGVGGYKCRICFLNFEVDQDICQCKECFEFS